MRATRLLNGPWADFEVFSVKKSIFGSKSRILGLETPPRSKNLRSQKTYFQVDLSPGTPSKSTFYVFDHDEIGKVEKVD